MMVGVQSVGPDRTSTRRKSTRQTSDKVSSIDNNNRSDVMGTGRSKRPSTRRSTRQTVSQEHVRRKATTRGESRSDSDTKTLTDSTRQKRTQIRAAQRARKRDTAGIKFLFAMFFVVVASTLAFGLLRDDNANAGSEWESSKKTYESRQSNTSTNTGILRGQNE